MPNPRRGVIPAAQDLQASNSTSNRFLGTSQRSWMQPGYQTSPLIARPAMQTAGRISHPVSVLPGYAVQQVIITREDRPLILTEPSDESLRQGSAESSGRTLIDSADRALRVQHELQAITSHSFGDDAPITEIMHTPSVAIASRNVSAAVDAEIAMTDADTEAVELRRPVLQSLCQSESETQGDLPHSLSPPSVYPTSRSKTSVASNIGPAAVNVADTPRSYPIAARIPITVVTGRPNSVMGNLHTVGSPQISSGISDDVYRFYGMSGTNSVSIPNNSTSLVHQGSSSNQQINANRTTSTRQGSPRYNFVALPLPHQDKELYVPPVESGMEQLPSPPVTGLDILPEPPLPQPAGKPDGIRSSYNSVVPNTPTIGASRVQQYEQKITELRRSLTIDSYTEGRLQMVRHAIEVKDVFYLTFNQLLCLWTIDPGGVASRFDLVAQHLSALHYLGMNGMPSAKLPRQILDLFSQFEPAELLQTERTKKVLVKQVKSFLCNCEMKMKHLLDICALGEAPPSASVAAHFQQCEASPVLQRLFFELVFRRLFDTRHQGFYMAAFHLFDANQLEFLQRLRQGFRIPSPNLFAEPDVQSFQAQFAQLKRRFNVSTVDVIMMRQGKDSRLTRNIAANARIATAANHTYQERASNAARHRSTSTNQHAPSPSQSSYVQWPHPIQPLQQSQAPVRNTAPDSQNESHGPNSDGNPRSLSSLLPPGGYILPTTVNNNSDKTALHQAHLRSPQFMSASLTSSPLTTPRVYTFFEAFLMPPVNINVTTGYLTEEITIPRDVFSSRVLEILPPKSDVYGQRKRVLNERTLLFKLRCVALNRHEANLDEITWLEKQTRWPECGFFSLNGDHVETRRKIHYQRDLSADVSFMVKDGQNRLEVSYHSVPAEKKTSFAVAIEVIRAVEHDVAATIPQMIDANVVLEGITSTLSKTNSDDDDLTMIDPYISIDLIDPFTSQICHQPVRGKQCLHRECFDLQAFLKSRVSRGKNDVISPDSWQCPICKRDARPNNLVLDGFLLGVGQQLASESRTGVRAILIGQDGTWSPRAQTAPADNVTGSASRESPMRQSNVPAADSSRHRSTDAGGVSPVRPGLSTDLPTKSQAIVIELDDE